MIRVLIADDHPIVRRGLRQILSDHPDIRFDEVGTIPEIRDFLSKRSIDVLVLDVNMPGGSGLEFISEIKKQLPRLPILVLSIQPEDQVGVRAIIAGAHGYLNKDSAPDMLSDAIRMLAEGNRFISKSLSYALADYLQRASTNRPLHETLSEREFTVFKMLAIGKSTGDIADALNLSPKTVSTYRARLLEKMGLDSNAALTMYAVEHGLLDRTK